MLKLLKDMESEHKLKLEIVELEGQLNVLKHMNVMGADEEKRKKKQIQEMKETLEELKFDMSELPKILKGGTDIGVKKLGEINAKPFKVVCKNMYKDNKKASLECAKLHAEWQNQILDSSWHPFRVLEIEGKKQGLDSQLFVAVNDPYSFSVSGTKQRIGDKKKARMFMKLVSTVGTNSSMSRGSQGSLQRSLSFENMIPGLIDMFCLQKLNEVIGYPSWLPYVVTRPTCLIRIV
ncbi:hypothetical protein RJT34_24957 [Clitoria ternatea]|uniref:Factor of DNA methylation 1-5/IDN2 domain-containing protein n=1 Tax=Clitoria ternatea TaxID=43366 RepID=A0AAN9FVS5_CLITE